MTALKYTDAHCHTYEIDSVKLDGLCKLFNFIVSVADDAESSLKTLKLGERYKYIVPCIGIHPWSTNKENLDDELRLIEKLASTTDLCCLGEIGLDKAFVPETFNTQLKVFRRLLEIARDYDLAVNLHAANAWKQTFEEVLRYGIRRALFHWYSGPLDILQELVARGYFISINPAVKISTRHLSVARKVPIGALLIESDGPYLYRGLNLNPEMIPETVELLAIERNIEPSELIKITESNLLRFLGLDR